MPLPRYRLRSLIITVAGIAVYLALLVSPIGVIVALVTGPAIGSMIHRRAGGRGVLGNMLGGVSEAWVFFVAMPLRPYLFPDPDGDDFLGPMLACAMGGLGIVAGTAVGLSVWGLAELVARLRRDRRPLP